MQEAHATTLVSELGLTSAQVQATVALLDQGDTVPFIARYRKEATANLDEVAIVSIRDRIEQLRALDKRREAVLRSLEEQGKLTDDLKAKVMAAATLSVLEDLYLPYRPKRRTRASMAKDKGLEPLAKVLWAQGPEDPAAEAAKFVDADKEVATPEDALTGARDIMAEWVSEDAEARAELRDLFRDKAVIKSKVTEGKQEQGAKFKDYFDWREPLRKAPSHRILAVRRGANEGVLTFAIQPDPEEAIAALDRRFVKGDGAGSEQVRTAVHDAYARLLSPAMETEMRLESKRRADEEAIEVFAQNLRDLLLTSPLGQKAVMAIDPGFRTGCKVVCLDAQGKLLHYEAIYPLKPQQKTDEAAAKILELVPTFGVEAIAVGNGTGGREAMAFCRGLGLDSAIPIEMVNESGASVYSASKTAREEFPDHDVTVRGAASIGRRLMDPLAELVKMDPKAIGVGQYQHDVEQGNLRAALDDMVMSCVNAVGVEVNTASRELLSYVSGLGPKLAGSIVSHRDEHGPFRSRQQFMEVAGMGPKTFEQCAGFLRIVGGDNALDASAVHPESYGIVEAMAADVGCTVPDLMAQEARRTAVDLSRYADDKVGMPTLTDIMQELAKPGRDPRKRFEPFGFEEGVHEITDLTPGMELPGVVTNVTNFGAFVDVGVHQDGLVHVSQLADHYVQKTSDVVRVHQKVKVTVLEVDLDRKRIALSMRQAPKEDTRKHEDEAPQRPAPKRESRPRADTARPSRPSRRPRREPRQPKPAAGGMHRSPRAAAPGKPFNNPFVEFFKDWKPTEKQSGEESSD